MTKLFAFNGNIFAHGGRRLSTGPSKSGGFLVRRDLPAGENVNNFPELTRCSTREEASAKARSIQARWIAEGWRIVEGAPAQVSA